MWKLLLLITGASAFINPYPKSGPRISKIDAAPLLLTPYIESGDIEQARNLALVTGLTPNITSYTGFFTIDRECDSNIFFWFFPSQQDWEKDPVSVWLNGGPGSSSLYGLFYENGPYTLTLDGTLILNPYSWNLNSSVIYIDNPVGTGFSYTTNRCYVSTEEEVGQGILNMLTQFFKLFPEISQNPFFLTGESYAGKYIPAIAHAIHTSENRSEINLQGVAIGDGWTDPVNQLAYADYLYQLGLIDSTLQGTLKEIENVIPVFVQLGDYAVANDLNDEMLYAFANAAGYDSFYNYLYELGEPEPDIAGWLTTDEVRNAIHVGNATYDDGSNYVYNYLYEDIMKSVRPWVEELLDNDYRVLLYNGEMDIICAYPLTMNFVKKMNWKGADEYKVAPRNIWYVDDEVAGYSKTVGNFKEVLVRKAGHMVPTDQPKWALDLYNRFIFNEPLKNTK